MLGTIIHQHTIYEVFKVLSVSAALFVLRSKTMVYKLTADHFQDQTIFC